MKKPKKQSVGKTSAQYSRDVEPRFTDAELNEATDRITRLAFALIHVCQRQPAADVEMALVMVLATTLDKMGIPRAEWIQKMSGAIVDAPNLDEVARRMNEATRAGKV